MGTEAFTTEGLFAFPTWYSCFPGALTEGRFLDKKQLQEAAKLPPIETLRGELTSILQMPARKTLSMTERQSQTLVQNLTQYVKDKSPAEGGESS